MLLLCWNSKFHRLLSIDCFPNNTCNNQYISLPLKIFHRLCFQFHCSFLHITIANFDSLTFMIILFFRGTNADWLSISFRKISPFSQMKINSLVACTISTLPLLDFLFHCTHQFSKKKYFAVISIALISKLWLTNSFLALTLTHLTLWWCSSS